MTITALMPSSRQARWMRKRQSRPVGDQDFLNMCGVWWTFCPSPAGSALFDHEQWPAVFDRPAVLAQDLRDGAGLVGLDLVEDLHGLDDADGIAA